MKFKALTFALLLLVMLQANCCLAKRCIACSEILPDDAAICSACLTPQPSVIQLEPQAPLTTQQRLVKLFSFLDDFEKYFHQNQYLNMLGLMPEVKIKFQNAAAVYKTMVSSLPQELKILAKLYANKYQVFEAITSLQKNLRIESSFRESLIRANMYKLALCNSMIAPFKTSASIDKSQAADIKERALALEKRMYKYTVTAKFLKIGGVKAQRGLKVMVTSVKGAKANVLIVGSTGELDPVEGTISLKNLAKHTNWSDENIKYYKD